MTLEQKLNHISLKLDTAREAYDKNTSSLDDPKLAHDIRLLSEELENIKTQITKEKENELKRKND